MGLLDGIAFWKKKEDDFGNINDLPQDLALNPDQTNDLSLPSLPQFEPLPMQRSPSGVDGMTQQPMSGMVQQPMGMMQQPLQYPQMQNPQPMQFPQTPQQQYPIQMPIQQLPQTPQYNGFQLQTQTFDPRSVSLRLDSMDTKIQEMRSQLGIIKTELDAIFQSVESLKIGGGRRF